jgi:putative flavoprotein involved in K+ transport
MSTQHIDTLVVGAGQAGLSVGFHLKRAQRDFLIVDEHPRIGDQWRNQWDTLRLYTPAKYDGLPGTPFPAADRWSFPSKDEVADYLESYALTWDLPVRLNTRVDTLTARDGGGFSATLGGDVITCDNVVVATGPLGRAPYVPDFASDLDPGILQLHSSAYRRPDQVPPGRVLVVGASHSGTDIAYELADAHDVVLAGRDCGQVPWRIEGRANHVGFPMLLFVFKHVLTRRTPMGRKEMSEVREHGGPMLRVKRQDLLHRGVERNLARVTGVVDGRPVLDDGTVVDARTVIWCTGFRQSYGWIKLPIFGDDGWPVEYRGEVKAAPGLFFCGLSFQYSFTSMFLLGTQRDAGYVAQRILRRHATTPAAA